METVIKLVLSAFIAAVCAWPYWTYLVISNSLNPEGFWQKIVMMGVGLWVLGGAQIFFLAIFVALMVMLWKQD